MTIDHNGAHLWNSSPSSVIKNVNIFALALKSPRNDFSIRVVAIFSSSTGSQQNSDVGHFITPNQRWKLPTLIFSIIKGNTGLPSLYILVLLVASSFSLLSAFGFVRP